MPELLLFLAGIATGLGLDLWVTYLRGRRTKKLLMPDIIRMRNLIVEHEKDDLDEKLRVSLQGYPPRDAEAACDAIDDAIAKAVIRMNDPARHPKEES